MLMTTVNGLSKDGSITYDNLRLPAKRALCWQCDGKGTQVNPSIDGNGLSSEDLSDPDFSESYFRGDYDIRCLECDGEKVILEIDEERCRTRLSWWKDLLRYRYAMQFRAQADAEDASERRLGC